MKHNESTEPTSKSWIIVLALLIGFPMVASLTLRFWLGVPTESHQSPELFSNLTLQETSLAEQESLHFGQLFFCKIRVKPDALSDFRAQLTTFESSEGVARKPISLKLERDWWQPPTDVQGTYWERGQVTLWSPKGHPDLFYGVVHLGSAGDEVEATKTSQ